MFRPSSATHSSFSLPAKDIKLHEKIGEGTFGIVYRGEYKKTIYAVKELQLKNLPEKQLEQFIHEVEIMASLNYPNIIRFFGYTEKTPYRIVMEYMDQGSLYNVLHSKAELDWTQRITWGKEIATGLYCLHTHTPVILHRDLKSLNVLIGSDNRARLSDFGSALAELRTTTASMSGSSSKKSDKPKELVGSDRWMAPELLENELAPTFTTASDIFAYAIILLEIASREIPYAKQGSNEVIKGAVRAGKRAEIHDSWPDTFKTLIVCCWNQEPRKRPSAEQAIETLQAALPKLRDDIPIVSTAMNRLIVADHASRGYAVDTSATKESRGYALESEIPAKAKPAAKPALKQLPAKPVPVSTAAAMPAKAPAQAAATMGFFARLFTRSTTKVSLNKVKQAELKKLLSYVACGDQDEAETMLKITGNEVLLLHKGAVSTPGSNFSKITAFQYALWALDWHMWKMLLQYLPKEEAASQLKDLESNSTEHGQHYDFAPLIEALKTYADNNAWEKKNGKIDRDKYWAEVVLSAQNVVPAHVANEYCRPDRSFAPDPQYYFAPSFKDDHLPRTFYILGDDQVNIYGYTGWWTSWRNKIYRRYAYVRGGRAGAELAESLAGYTKDVAADFLRDVRSDRNAITHLCKVRMGQYEELKRELTAHLSTRPQP